MSAPALPIIAIASGSGAGVAGTEAAPAILKSLGLEILLGAQGHNPIWLENTPASALQAAATAAALTQTALITHPQFLLLGGDHSLAAGTWAGAANAFPNQPLGLIWVDAHMDAHTPATTPSGNIHGMPVAALLGYGQAELTSLSPNGPALQPQNIVQIGIRSYESGEAELLKKLGVRQYHMDEVHARGLPTVWAEALTHVTAHTSHFGLSLDVDAFDLTQAPGVGSPAAGGLNASQLLPLLKNLAIHPAFVGMELVELNPSLDIANTTAHLAVSLLKAVWSPH